MNTNKYFALAVLASLFAVGGVGAANAVEPDDDGGVIEDVSDGYVGDGDVIEPEPGGDPIDTGDDPGLIDDGVVVDDGTVIDDGGVTDDGIVVVDNGDDPGVIDDGGVVDDGTVIDDGGVIDDGVVVVDNGEDPGVIDEGGVVDDGTVDVVDAGGVPDGEVPEGEVLDLPLGVEVYAMGELGGEEVARGDDFADAAHPLEAFDIADETGGDVDDASAARLRRR